MGHTQLQALLACPGELSRAERVRLDGHLQVCPECQELARILAENRDRLKALGQLRPPAELDERLRDVAADSRAAFSFWAPLLCIFCIVPASLFSLVLVAAYGPLALFALLAGLALLGLLFSRHQPPELPPREDAAPLGAVVRAWLVDFVGVGLGLTVLLLIMLLLALLSGTSLPL